MAARTHAPALPLRKEEYPEFMQAVDKYIAIKEEIKQLGEQLAQASSYTAPSDDRTKNAALAYLNGQPVEPAEPEDPRRHIRELRGRKEVLEEALKLQQQRYEQISRDIDERVSLAHRGEYEEIMRELVEHAAGVGRAADRAHLLVRKLQEGSTHSFRHLPVPGLYDVLLKENPHSRLNRILAEIQEAYRITPPL